MQQNFISCVIVNVLTFKVTGTRMSGCIESDYFVRGLKYKIWCQFCTVLLEMHLNISAWYEKSYFSISGDESVKWLFVGCMTRVLILSRCKIFVIANMSTSSTGFVQHPIHCLPLPVSSFWLKLIDPCWYRTSGALQSYELVLLV